MSVIFGQPCRGVSLISLWARSNAKISAFDAPKKTRFASLNVLVPYVCKYVGCTRTAKMALAIICSSLLAEAIVQLRL
jgi:hypothetical protein